MSDEGKSTLSIPQLIAEVKTYLELQKEYARLELTEKLTVLLSTLILVLVIVVLSMVALFYLSFTLAYVLAPVLGGLVASFGLITLFLIALILFIYYKRQTLIVNPMVRFLASVFLKEPDTQVKNPTINHQDAADQP